VKQLQIQAFQKKLGIIVLPSSDYCKCIAVLDSHQIFIANEPSLTFSGPWL